VVDSIKNGEYDLIVNTTESRHSRLDSETIRRQALTHKVTYFTTLAAARAACEAHRAGNDASVNRLQTLHQTVTV
jgi:carbamoyl-phosphate synthase large subunit